jgi:glyoxylase-like metal-dependent hydrolase (beta-lactamase superfamily II)
MRIIPLSEGAFTIDKTKEFIPFNVDTDDLQARAKGSLLVEIQPFAIITSKDIIVIDTGLGFSSADGVLQIHQNLIENDINPGEVTKVLLSHLHKDHAGAISRSAGGSSSRILSFDNATYYVNKEELANALDKENQSYHPEEFSILKDSERVVVLEGNGVIDDYIRYELTGAHSPFTRCSG